MIMANIHLAVSQEESTGQPKGSGLFSVLRDELRVEEITTLENLLALREEWTELLANSHARVIFITPEWIITWWQLFGHDDSVSGVKTLWVLTVRQGTRLVGLAPLMIVKRKRFGFTLRLLEFIGGGFGDYSDFILDDQRKISVLNLLWEHIAKRKVWDIGILDDFSGLTDHASLSEKCTPETRLCFQATVSAICPHVHISGTWDSFYEETFKRRVHGGQRRRKLGQLERQLASTGKLSYKLIYGLREDPLLFEKIAAVQERGSGSGNLFRDASKRLFLERFALETSDKDWVRISTLEIDGNWVAYYLGFHYRKHYSLYNTNFVQETARYSPGSILMIQLLKNAFAEGLEEVDLMRGGEDYKFHWTNGSRFNARLEFYRADLISRLIRYLYRSLLPRIKGLLTNLKRKIDASGASHESHEAF